MLWSGFPRPADSLIGRRPVLVNLDLLAGIEDDAGAYLEECGTEVSLICPNGAARRLGNQQQKGVDVTIGTLALIQRDRYETLFSSSGDGDLLDAIEFLTEHGKRFELAVFNSDGCVHRPSSQGRSDRLDQRLRM